MSNRPEESKTKLAHQILSALAEADPDVLPPAKQAGRRKAPKRPSSAGGYTGSGSDPRDPKPLGAALANFTKRRGWRTEFGVRALMLQWPSLIGPDNAAHCEPESYADGEIIVRCESTAWATQLRFLAPQVLAAINARLPEQKVRRITFRGPQQPKSAGKFRVRGGRGPRDTYG